VKGKTKYPRDHGFCSQSHVGPASLVCGIAFFAHKPEARLVHLARWKGPDQPPNNWQSWFGHSAWTFDPITNQYYYHHFYTEQPDLNWRNPQVRNAMYDAMRFWLGRGVAGFRIDAVSRLFEDPNLHDDPICPGRMLTATQISRTNTRTICRSSSGAPRNEKRGDEFPGNPVLISEADEPNIAELTKMYGSKNDEIQLPMDFQIADVNKLSAPISVGCWMKSTRTRPAGNPTIFSAITISRANGIVTETASTTIRSPNSWRRCF